MTKVYADNCFYSYLKYVSLESTNRGPIHITSFPGYFVSFHESKNWQGFLQSFKWQGFCIHYLQTVGKKMAALNGKDLEASEGQTRWYSRSEDLSDVIFVGDVRHFAVAPPISQGKAPKWHGGIHLTGGTQSPK